MGEVIANGSADGNGVHPVKGVAVTSHRSGCWYEEEIEEDLRWCFALNSILRTCVSNYQDIALLDTKPFGKALVIDGKLQSAEVDEFIYHECLVHPPLLCHSKQVFTELDDAFISIVAQDALLEEVVDFCRKYLLVNREVFCSNRLELIINDARDELESRVEQFDIIVGDLADPVEGGPCFKLYTKSFYEYIVKPKLSDTGMFVTQAGPAGVLTHTDVFSSIYNTLKQVFKYVLPYTAHVPSYSDTWGWASDHQPFALNAEDLNNRINQVIKGELRYLDGQTLIAATTLSKSVRKSLAKESHVYTEETARFVHGHGKAL
eukprot:Gb_38598 [translate_table: standard]